MSEELDNFETTKKPKGNLFFQIAISAFVVSILFKIQHYPGAYWMDLISSGVLLGYALFHIFKTKKFSVTLLLASLISVFKIGVIANYLFSGWRFPELNFAIYISIAFGTFVWLKS